MPPAARNPSCTRVGFSRLAAVYDWRWRRVWLSLALSDLKGFFGRQCCMGIHRLRNCGSSGGMVLGRTFGRLGARRVILIGLCIWVVFEVLFITIGLAYHSVPLLLVTYGLRGFGYPLFAFGFLVWIVVAAPGRGLATAMGWFWFAFTGGLPTLGSALASWAVPRAGEVPTFWIATALVTVSGLVLLVCVR